MNYVIQQGDTLWDLARRHGTTVEALARENGIANPDLIRAGMTLNIPGAEMQPTTGATPRPRPPSVAAQADSAPLPNPRPGPEAATPPRTAGDGMVDRQFTQPTGRTPPTIAADTSPTRRAPDAQANLDYSIPIEPTQPQQIAQPSLGSVITGALTPIPGSGPPPPAQQAYLDQSRALETAGAQQQAGEPQRIAAQDARWRERDAAAAPAPGPADAIRQVGADMWQGRQGDAFRRGPQGTAPRGEMDPTLANRAAVRDAMRAFTGMTEEQLWALDRSNFDDATFDAWRRAVSAAMMDPNLRRGAGPGV